MKKKSCKSAFIVRHLFSLLLAAVMLIWMISSCSKFSDKFDFDKIVTPGWDPEFAIPLVNSTYSLQDIIGDSSSKFIKVNPDNSLSFVYSSDRVFSLPAGEVIELPNFQNQFETPVILPPLPPGNSYSVTVDHAIPFIGSSADQRFDSIFLKSGVLQIAGETTLNKDVAKLVIELPGIINISTGEDVVMDVPLNNPGGVQPTVSFDESVNLNDYKIIFENGFQRADNLLSIKLTFTIEGDNNPNNSPYNFSLLTGFREFMYERMFGYFGAYNISLSDSVMIDIFKKTIGGGVDLGPNTVKLFIDINNSFGMPVTFVSDSLYVYSPVNEPYYVDVELFGSGIPNIFAIQSPDLSQIGTSVETNLDFNNSNMWEAFNIAPELFYFQFSGLTNPDGNASVENFVLAESIMSMDVSVEMQLFTAISEYLIEDTLTSSFNNLDEIESLLFRVNATNGFPLTARLQLYFTDDNYQVIDSLITSEDDKIIDGAPVSGPPDYRVTGTKHKMTDMEMTGSRLDNIVAAKYMILRAGLSTTNEQLVKIYNDYSLQIKIGTIAGLNISGN